MAEGEEYIQTQHHKQKGKSWPVGSWSESYWKRFNFTLFLISAEAKSVHFPNGCRFARVQVEHAAVYGQHNCWGVV